MANDLAPDGLLLLLDVEIDIAIFLLLLVIRWLETKSKIVFFFSPQIFNLLLFCRKKDE